MMNAPPQERCAHTPKGFFGLCAVCLERRERARVPEPIPPRDEWGPGRNIEADIDEAVRVARPMAKKFFAWLFDENEAPPPNVPTAAPTEAPPIKVVCGFCKNQPIFTVDPTTNVATRVPCPQGHS